MGKTGRKNKISDAERKRRSDAMKKLNAKKKTPAPPDPENQPLVKLTSEDKKAAIAATVPVPEKPAKVTSWWDHDLFGDDDDD